MNWFRRRSGKTAQPAAAPQEQVIVISTEVMNHAFPDRSAGRYCAHCKQHGQHHTDRHNDFAREALRHQDNLVSAH